MQDQVKDWIQAILTDEGHQKSLKVAAQGRAKFEGWLKFELVREAVEHHATNVRVEIQNKSVPQKNQLIDLSFQLKGTNYYLELKTPRAGWSNEGLENLDIKKTTNHIGGDIRAIMKDAVNLKKFIQWKQPDQPSSKGIIAFVAFPLAIDRTLWWANWQKAWSNAAISVSKLRKISKAALPELPKEEDCRFVPISLKGGVCDFMVCCFPWP